MKKKAFEEAGLPQPTETSPKKQTIVHEKMSAAATANTGEPPAKKQKQGNMQGLPCWFEIDNVYMKSIFLIIHIFIYLKLKQPISILYTNS